MPIISFKIEVMSIESPFNSTRLFSCESTADVGDLELMRGDVKRKYEKWCRDFLTAITVEIEGDKYLGAGTVTEESADEQEQPSTA